MDRFLSVTIEGQVSPAPLDPGWVKEIVARYRRDGIEPRILVEAKHGISHVRFTCPPPTSGKSGGLDEWEAAVAKLWQKHSLNTTPIKLHELCAFLGRVQSML